MQAIEPPSRTVADLHDGAASSGRDEMPRPRRLATVPLATLILGAALWGLVVDSPLLPILAPTNNSTLLQASTAALFAVIGILYGPLAGGLCGLARDGTGYLLTALVLPGSVAHVGILPWLGLAAVDILEDVVLGLLPGLVARYTRRVGLLALASAVAAWISLPFLVAGDTLILGHASQLWAALTTAPGDWNEPVDPGLTVYALLTGALVALALARWTTRPRVSLLIGVLFAAPAFVLIALGAHV